MPFFTAGIELLLPSGTGGPSGVPESEETKSGIVSSTGRLVEIESELPTTWNAFFRPSGASGDFAEAPTVETVGYFRSSLWDFFASITAKICLTAEGVKRKRNAFPSRTMAYLVSRFGGRRYRGKLRAIARRSVEGVGLCAKRPVAKKPLASLVSASPEGERK